MDSKRIVLVALAAFVASATAVGAQELQQVNVSPSTGAGLKPGSLHAKPLAGATPDRRTTTLRQGGNASWKSHADNGASGRPRYPADLQYHGGHVLDHTVLHTIFVNPTAACPANACWGDPIGFLRDFNRSKFIHVTDQYVGTDDDSRYPLGTNYIVDYPVGSNPLTDLDIEIIAYAVASYSGQSGYGHLYHVFLVPGQDLCFDTTYSQCYSPDNPPTFFFCGYHSSFDSPAGHVLYSAEPYQDVNGCSVRPDAPNGQVIDSTNNVLSHETSEAITDPDGTAWWNSLDNGLYGQEIGDECSFLAFLPDGSVYFDPSNVVLNGKLYAIQPEYSNDGHICQTGRHDDDDN